MVLKQATFDHYDPMTISLHSITAVLVILLWVIGQTTDYIPEGHLNNAIWSAHIVLGFGLALILGLRIIWRLTAGRVLPPADEGVLNVVAKGTHLLLYGLLLAVVGFGILNAFVRGYDLFGLLKLPQLGDPTLKKPITHWHELAANAVMIVAFCHATAALIHHYAWHDGVLRRMTR